MQKNLPELQYELLFDFSSIEQACRWRPVNDVIMGGRSSGTICVSNENVAVFEGFITPKQGIGFSSVKAPINNFSFLGYDGVCLKMRTDGKRYKFRLIYADDYQGFAYQHGLEIQKGEWREVHLAFSNFKPCFRGQQPANAKLLNIAQVRQVGLLISDRRAGAFKMECDWIKAYQEK
ncbi:NADH:ubiquinone oxidoreductase complex I intermediate-associated protein 30 [Chloroherpeton thalassium ATCC 35110]|uniref:NADH:ubiquinone oxidoreductase complex I intermediate-associated protein 30 n=1 Tax=Chloroherpeton thalassium (strain ATCC 35110 / GB-78) TaxID=517418 RepID=B3QTG8_CHLT3|nr:CIA30 family protein [Chloroherpeton thalassium]ACF12714.1 NADH:ubiquinone oxidoreductase complex I intermediate-associated protein 30 [Chloroherpeton thalassium ATCC 35110]